MANLRKLTGVLRKALNGEPWAGARVNIRLLTDPATQAGEVFPVLNFTFHTAVDGSVPDNVFVATPDSGAWRYRVGIHGNTPFEAYVEGTGDISLDDLIALANLPGQEPGEPVSDWLVHLYGQSLLADPLDVPTPAGEWRTLGTAAEADTADFDPAGSAAAVGDAFLDHTGLTTTAHGGIVASTDPRLTDERTPTAHAASHATDGSDPISPASIGAEVAGAAATVQTNLNTLSGIVTATVNGSYTVNAEVGSVFNLTLTANSTIGFSNLAGRVVEVNIIQDGVGLRLVTWTSVQWGATGVPTLLTGAGDRDKLTFSNNGLTTDGHLVEKYEA